MICAGRDTSGAVRSGWQRGLQPSPGRALPSSQSSSGVSRMPSPQRPGVQSGRQRALGRALFSSPASQISPGSMRALPQKGGSSFIWAVFRHRPSTQSSPVAQSARVVQERSVQTPLAHMPERHCSSPVQGLQDPATQTAPGEQSRASAQPMKGAEEEEDGTKTMTGEEEDEEERGASQRMQGRPGVWKQLLFWAAQKESPPMEHSVPVQSPPTGMTEEEEREEREVISVVQEALQPSLLRVLPSSHCSVIRSKFTCLPL